MLKEAQLTWGNPLFIKRRKMTSFQFLVDKIKNRFGGGLEK